MHHEHRATGARGRLMPMLALSVFAGALIALAACESQSDLSRTSTTTTETPQIAAAKPPATPAEPLPEREVQDARGQPNIAVAPPPPPPPPPLASPYPYPSQALQAAPKSSAIGAFRKDAYAQPYAYQQAENTERYPNATPNAVKVVTSDPVSTFSVDVDTASYSNVRRYLNEGALPPADAVRVEEMINYFDYAYSLPREKTAPFQPTVAVYPSPWNKGTQILHIGIKGFDLPKTERPNANLVFLIDTSGSMEDPNKLPLLIRSFHLLVDQLRPEDKVSIVVYAGSAGTILEPTSGADKQKILAALDKLHAGGSTAGGEGIRQAYQLAKSNFDKNAVNRVLLATDGDFNVGITDPKALEDYVTRERSSGIFLTVLGFGEGNYNDVTMQKLAQAGNGVAAYIDTMNEARKVFVDEIGGTLFTIAKDVKIQVEFNPKRVAEYRLIGYETRALNRTDFNNDKVDAGDIGSGHTVTALYEITPVGSDSTLADPLRYGQEPVENDASRREIAFVKLRYKLPKEDNSRLIERPVTDRDVAAEFDRIPADMRFAAAVAGGGQLLRHDPYVKDLDFGRVIAMAQSARGEDSFGYRSEFVQLMRMAQSAAGLKTLDPSHPGAPQ